MYFGKSIISETVFSVFNSKLPENSVHIANEPDLEGIQNVKVGGGVPPWFSLVLCALEYGYQRG